MVKKHPHVEYISSQWIDSVHPANGSVPLPDVPFFISECVACRHVHIQGHSCWVEVWSFIGLFPGIESEEGSQLCFSTLLYNLLLFTTHKNNLLLVLQVKSEYLNRRLVLCNGVGQQFPGGFT